MLVTEQPGPAARRQRRRQAVASRWPACRPVDARGQGGLLDVALDPAFATNQLIYWSYAEPRDGGMNNTAVARGKFVDGAAPRVENVQVIYHQAPSLTSTLHFGGRLVFGRDGTLFITQGERSITEGRMQAQRMDGLLGKIVRINADGSIPKDNPFVGKEGVRPEIWSLGHRNVQAATLQSRRPASCGKSSTARAAATRSTSRARARTTAGRRSPTASSTRAARSPAASRQKDGHGAAALLLGSGHRAERHGSTPATCSRRGRAACSSAASARKNLVRLTLEGEKVVGEERLLKDLQPKRERIRDVRQGPDGALYLLTDNAKGRILKLVPKQ